MGIKKETISICSGENLFLGPVLKGERELAQQLS